MRNNVNARRKTSGFEVMSVTFKILSSSCSIGSERLKATREFVSVFSFGLDMGLASFVAVEGSTSDYCSAFQCHYNDILVTFCGFLGCFLDVYSLIPKS